MKYSKYIQCNPKKNLYKPYRVSFDEGINWSGWFRDLNTSYDFIEKQLKKPWIYQEKEQFKVKWIGIYGEDNIKYFKINNNFDKAYHKMMKFIFEEFNGNYMKVGNW